MQLGRLNASLAHGKIVDPQSDSNLGHTRERRVKYGPPRGEDPVLNEKYRHLMSALLESSRRLFDKLRISRPERIS